MCFASGGVKELGFWEVNQTTLQDVHEVAPSQEEMQAAADAKASAESAEAPRQVWCKSHHLLSCISAGADVSSFRTTVKSSSLNILPCIPTTTSLLKALLSGSERPK